MKPGPAYRKQVARVLLAVAWFAIVYLVLTSLTAVAAVALCYLGFQVILLKVTWITIMAGIGIASVGVMVLVFLIRFIFMSWTPDQSGTIAVSGEDQPELVAFIRRVAAEAKVRPPKRIVIGPEVNAAVYYTSSFWSMFLPVRKNLRIGLGLVNGISIGEFKAVLAHEFGHFSQGSMRVGSYVYTVNHVIRTLLYDNEGYAGALGRLGDISGWFDFFNGFTVGIINAIQSILRRVHVVVYRTYMGLSREMEFHADAVASSIAGSDQSVSALYRIDIADSCYSAMLGEYRAWSGDHARPDNAYRHHGCLIASYAEYYRLPLRDGLPDVRAGIVTPAKRIRIVPEDVWASHPSLMEREMLHRRLDSRAEPATAPAWTVVRDPITMQAEMTRLLFPPPEDGQRQTVLSHDEYLERRAALRRETALPDMFGRYFGQRYPSWTGPPDQGSGAATQPDVGGVDSILDPSALDLVETMAALNADLQRVIAIDENPATAGYFYFDGARYDPRSAALIRAKLEVEARGIEDRLREIDARLLRHLYVSAKAAGRYDEFATAADGYFMETRELREAFGRVKEIDDAREVLARIRSDDPEAVITIDRIEEHEKALKPLVERMMTDEVRGAAGEDHCSVLRGYIGSEPSYLFEDAAGDRLYSKAAISALDQSLSSIRHVLAVRSFLSLRSFLRLAARSEAG